MDRRHLDFMVHHVLLPPRLPGKEEGEGEGNGNALLEFMGDAVDSFQSRVGTDLKHHWARICKMFEAWEIVQNDQEVEKEKLVETMARMMDGESLPLFIAKQNAGLIMRARGQTLAIECFEASPCPSAVMEAKARLRCSFPGRIVEIPLSLARTTSFQRELADLIQALSIEQVEDVMPTTRKAGSNVTESRETADPRLVSDLLMSLLAAYGAPIRPQRVYKKIRDDVCWSDSELPWRRSGLYLVCRVALQSALVHALAEEEGLTQYKNFMLFFLAKLSKRALAATLESDILFTLNAKIARRAAKLKEPESFVRRKALKCARRVRDELGARQQSVWKSFDKISVASISTERVSSESTLSLERSKPYLLRALKLHEQAKEPIGFSPQCPKRMSIASTGLPEIKFSSFTSTQLLFALADFEAWVEYDLPKVDFQQRSSQEVCSTLSQLLSEYIDNGSRAYHSFADQLSIMLLTILELWQAVDKLVLLAFPLLEEYSPEIPSSFLEPLLLPKMSQMERCSGIEGYLKARHANAKMKHTSLFADPAQGSFAVRFFEGSQDLQKLKQDIENHAQEKRREKQTELASKSESYRSLLASVATMDCKCVHRKVARRKWIVDQSLCGRCPLSNRAKGMRISVHEWPLPENSVQCKTAIFELACPKGIAVWRDITYRIVNDVGGFPSKKGETPKVTLFQYEGLRAYLNDRSRRISIASTTKTFSRTHYSEQSFPVTADMICVKNGLHFRLFDQQDTSWVAKQTAAPSIRSKCQSVLPSGRYKNLQDFVDTTCCTANEVLANQHACSPKVSLHEYLAFSTLRSGEHLQLLNILRELASTDLSFKSEAVHTLIVQAAWQAGSPSQDVRRASHAHFEDDAFTDKLFEVLKKKTEEVKTNWKELFSLSTIVILTLRLLSLGRAPHVVDEASLLLLDVRKISLQWTRELVDILDETTDASQITTAQQRVLRAAFLCRMTFNVERRHRNRLLESNGGLPVFLECSVYIHDNYSTSHETLPFDLRRSFLRDRRLSHSLEGSIRALVQRDRSGLDMAIGQIWRGFTTGSSWEALKAPNGSWLVTTTSSASKKNPLAVHFNILEGKLLVDGKPLGRLPEEYTSHQTYRRVLGPRVLRVCKADMPGMLYMTASELFGYQLYFGMGKQELIIRTKRGLEVLELIPQHCFMCDLPLIFVEDYVHWLLVAADIVELRPIEKAWASSSRNWRIHLAASTFPYMRLDQRRLINLKGSFTKQIGGILAPIEEQEWIHISVLDDGTVEIVLPRYSLKFVVNELGHLYSPELSAIVDPDQSLETFYGLKSRLVLRQAGPSMTHYRRSVIVPYGSVSISKLQGHTLVSVSTGSQRSIRWYRFELDTTLRRLGGAHGFVGGLYKAYIHAVTSHLLPDLFTGRTGTEESIQCLRTEALFPSEPLSENALELLNQIATLTPMRDFYPRELRKMQQVTWNDNLSPIVQHDDFRTLAEDIVKHDTRLSVFYDPRSRLVMRNRGAAHLLERARLRNSTLRTCEFGGALPFDDEDMDHEPRDRGIATAGALRAFGVVSLVRGWPSRLNVTRDLLQMLVSWRSISGYGEHFPRESITDLLHIDIGRYWGSLYKLCRSASQRNDSHRLALLFGVIAYGGQASLIAIRTLLAFAFTGRFQGLEPPSHISYDLTQLFAPQEYRIRDALQDCSLAFESSETANLPAQIGEGFGALQSRRRSTFDGELNRQIDSIIEDVVRQWPCREPEFRSTARSHIHMDQASRATNALFQTWFKNRELELHVGSLQRLLNDIDYPPTEEETFEFIDSDDQGHPPSPNELVTVDWSDLFSRAPPQLPYFRAVLSMQGSAVSIDQNSSHFELQRMTQELSASENESRARYGADLQDSIAAFQAFAEVPEESRTFCALEVLQEERNYWEAQLKTTLELLCKALGPKSDIEHLVMLGCLWPRLNTGALLKLLSPSNAFSLEAGWRDAILGLAKVITHYQRSERLLAFAFRGDHAGLWKEVQNPGHEGWSIEHRPEWLLMEIEGDFLIRPMQAKVADEMISPRSDSNSVLQLNMGEGKSSVIIPMVAAVLADGERLARVVVLKPLMRQMSHLLKQRLGGLGGRRVYYTPFSRKTNLKLGVASTIKEAHQECKETRGILLVQPEQLLSFKLIRCERLSAGDLHLASQLWQHQHWLSHNSRDILDESDEILDVRFQVIYTIGSSKPLEGQPYRWIIAEAIFDVVRKQAAALQEQYPGRIELGFKAIESFPTIRFLQRGIGDSLMASLIQDIDNGAIPGVSFDHCPRNVRAAVLGFIQDPEPDPGHVELVARYFADETMKENILLLRGLIAHRTLLFALQSKRWMVNYGLDMSRCMMAVPYRAKGVPSLNAEFGHPDVAILLTCLSYYYTGLNDSQLRQCFRLLEAMDDPTLDYERWQKQSERLPHSLRQFSNVNIDDEDQCQKSLFPHMRYNKSVIDFFMTQMVFPKEGKDYAKKLTTSGWDIPAERLGEALTTGFSGTNDNRYLLPLSITQRDLPELQSTSARVLNYVLQEENRHYVCARDHDTGERLNVEGMLKLVADQEPAVRVLLDVGAQILELVNQEVAYTWLELVPAAEAAVFFDDEDEVVVLDRDGNTERLQISPFRERLGHCVIYLDDVHTRGTDLRIPAQTRAAVTLGQGLTKDKLVQACMRMRKLGSSHSVMFIAPPDVHHAILEIAGKADSDPVDGRDVIRWALEQTCLAIENNKALWVMQGFNHVERQRAVQRFRRSCRDLGRIDERKADISTLLHVLEEKEAKTLQSLYGIEAPEKGVAVEADASDSAMSLDGLTDGRGSPMSIDERGDSAPENGSNEGFGNAHSDRQTVDEDERSFSDEETERVGVLKVLAHARSTLNQSALRNSAVQEEQEREVAHEVELERQVQRPRAMEPLKHNISNEVSQFVVSGHLPIQKARTIVAAQHIFDSTSAGLPTQLGIWSSQLMVSLDFLRTVDMAKGANRDEYLRPINWILVSAIEGKNPAWLIVSPYEANGLMPAIRRSGKVRLHMYAPKVSKTMLSFDAMTFHSIPAAPPTWAAAPNLCRQLSLFAGNLYFETYEEYRNLCHFLGLYTVGSDIRDHDADVEVRGDGFVPPGSRYKLWKRTMELCPFSKSPLPFVKAVVAIRRRGHNFDHTHMGHIINSRLLNPDKFSQTPGGVTNQPSAS